MLERVADECPRPAGRPPTPGWTAAARKCLGSGDVFVGDKWHWRRLQTRQYRAQPASRLSLYHRNETHAICTVKPDNNIADNAICPSVCLSVCVSVIGLTRISIDLCALFCKKNFITALKKKKRKISRSHGPLLGSCFLFWHAL